MIPALDEMARIAATIEHVRTLSPAIDVVVADGGSHDGTADAAHAAGARVVTSPPGRGPQMNAGARLARGTALLFLHADCRLPPNALAAIDAIFAGGHEAGIFAIRYDSRHPMLRLAGAMSRFETRFTSFGEGALFVRRETFEFLGGFADWPLFEDVDFLARLRARKPIGRAAGAVIASARRYESQGVLRRQLRNAALLTLYVVGVSPRRLARIYPAMARGVKP